MKILAEPVTPGTEDNHIGPCIRVEKVEAHNMDKPWYRKLFSRTPVLPVKSTRSSADEGDAEAQFALGIHFGAGEGALPDYPEAARWYRKAADQNHHLAQFNLGMMYALGQGMPPDDDASAGWMRRAADGGDVGAQFNLGMRCHRASISGPKAEKAESRIEAFKWFHLAAAQGYLDSEACCERVTVDMTAADVTEGNKRAAAFTVGKAGGKANAGGVN